MNKCIYLSIRAVSLSDAHTHTHTHSLWLSCQQFVFACACVSLYGPHFECFSDTCRLFDSKLLCPVPLCVCVCVCVCIRQRHHSYAHERETHTVTVSDREGDTFTHIHTFFHSLSLSDHCDVTVLEQASIRTAGTSKLMMVMATVTNLTTKPNKSCVTSPRGFLSRQ